MSRITLQKNFYCLLALCLFTKIALSQPSFSAYDANPILSYGLASEDWDSGILYLPEVIEKDGTYYMFYTASVNLLTTPMSIGYATSMDGMSWTKQNQNPIFEADGTGFDTFQVAEGRLILDNNTWIMYYGARSQAGPGPGPYIGRATAPDPAGPWSRLGSPVLQVGGEGEWDSGFINPNAIVRVDTGYVMYYSGGTGFPFPPNHRARLGMATSVDGITWSKYDDPSTEDAPFAESDPVLDIGSQGSYDSGLAWEADVLQTTSGWEMFYTCDPDFFPFESICYATSVDGISWEKTTDNPIFQPSQDGSWVTLDLVLGSVILVEGQHYAYYMGNTSLFNGQIGMAITNTATSISPIEGSTAKFEMYPNYPNPFRSSTTIEFDITSPANVNIRIYDILGREVVSLVNRYLTPGKHNVEWDASDAPNGLYVVKMTAGSFSKVTTIVLQK